MAHRRAPGYALLAAVLLAAGCASAPPTPAPPMPPAVTAVAEPAAGGSVFVLLAGRDGSVGSVVVSNGGGTVVLQEANASSRVTNAGDPPGPATPLSAEEVLGLFGPAIANLVPPPNVYLLYFDSGSIDLKPESAGIIDLAARDIASREGADVSIVGHTNTRGDKRLNDEISLRRARAVAALLSSRGIDISEFEVSSHGKDSPLVPTGDQTDEPRNRRVEITVR